MTNSMTTASIPRRGIVVATLVSALLSIAGYMAISPSTASAGPGNGRCESSEFCLARLTVSSGADWTNGLEWPNGMYDNSGSDGRLYDNLFVPSVFDRPVDNNTWSAANRAIYSDVLIYDRNDHTNSPEFRAPGCIRRGRGVNLARWRDHISSFKFVPANLCRGYSEAP
jgi:hypothetical protein